MTRYVLTATVVVNVLSGRQPRDCAAFGWAEGYPVIFAQGLLLADLDPGRRSSTRRSGLGTCGSSWTGRTPLAGTG